MADFRTADTAAVSFNRRDGADGETVLLGANAQEIYVSGTVMPELPVTADGDSREVAGRLQGVKEFPGTHGGQGCVEGKRKNDVDAQLFQKCHFFPLSGENAPGRRFWPDSSQGMSVKGKDSGKVAAFPGFVDGGTDDGMVAGVQSVEDSHGPVNGAIDSGQFVDGTQDFLGQASIPRIAAISWIEIRRL